MAVIPADTILVHHELVHEAVVASNRTLSGGNAIHVTGIQLSDAMPMHCGSHVRQPICDVDPEGVAPAGLDLRPRIYAIVGVDGPHKAVSIESAFDDVERVLRMTSVSIELDEAPYRVVSASHHLTYISNSAWWHEGGIFIYKHKHLSYKFQMGYCLRAPC